MNNEQQAMIFENQGELLKCKPIKVAKNPFVC